MHRLERLCSSCNRNPFCVSLSKPELSHPGHKERISSALPQFSLSLESCSSLFHHHRSSISGGFTLFPILAHNSVLLSHNRKTLKRKVRIPGFGPWLWSLRVVWPWTNHLWEKRTTTITITIALIGWFYLPLSALSFTTNHWIRCYYCPHFINKEMWHREAKLVLQFMTFGR